MSGVEFRVAAEQSHSKQRVIKFIVPEVGADYGSPRYDNNSLAALARRTES